MTSVAVKEQIGNARFQNALARRAQSVPPIWLMRQAGRYHQHYQALRQKHSFVDLCKQPELAAEVALGPVQDFDFDAAILFSDLLFPLEALGIALDYADRGPQLDRLCGWTVDVVRLCGRGFSRRCADGFEKASGFVFPVLPSNRSIARAQHRAATQQRRGIGDDL